MKRRAGLTIMIFCRPNEVVPGPPTLPLQFFYPPGPPVYPRGPPSNFSGPIFAFDDAVQIGTWEVTLHDATPLPAALPLSAIGLGALGLLGWRRKKNQQQHSLLDWNTR